MDKDVKDLLEWLADKAGDVANLWGMENVIVDGTPEDKTTLLKIFNVEQLALITQLLKNVVAAIKWHNEEDSESHPEIRENIKSTDAKLRNHRHDLNKTFSAKPEF
jgi:ribosome biogenesis SPOUT family RNA methylase Rps3